MSYCWLHFIKDNEALLNSALTQQLFYKEYMDKFKKPVNPNSKQNLNGKGNLNTHIEKVSPTSYQEGYIHGHASERSLENEYQEIRDKRIATRSFLLGIGLTSLVGLTAGTLFFLNQNHQQESPTPVNVPSRSASPSSTQKTTIERTTETQESVTSDEDSEPEVEETVPSSEQQQPPTQPSATPQNQTLPANPSPTQQNTTPQTKRVPSAGGQPYISTQASPSQPQNQTSAGTGTSTTSQPNTTNQTSSPQTQNQDESDDSSSSDSD